MATPVSLQKQCMVYVACHLEYFSPDTLTLLPTTVQTQLVHSLPVADVCALEGTALAQNIDFDSIWKKICMHHPMPPTFPDMHFKEVYSYESMKDYFFTLIWHLALSEQAPVIHRIRTRTHLIMNWTSAHTRGMVLDSGASDEGYRSFCYLLVSMQSAADIDRHDSTYQCLLQLPQVLRAPYVPRRYIQFSDTQTQWRRSTMTHMTRSGAFFHSSFNMARLVLKTCKYRPRALQLRTYDFLRTQLWNGSEIEEVASIFKEIRYLRLIVQEEFNQDQVRACSNFLMGVMPTALRTLQQLRIRFENSTALNLFLPMIHSVIANSVYNEITDLHTLALAIDRRAENESMCDKSEHVLSLFSNLFEASHFQTLIFESMRFRDEVRVPKIMASFLSTPCTGKQRLVLSRVQFNYCGLTTFPNFALPPCAHKHKELKFSTMTLQPRVMEKLLSKPGFQLRLLEVLFEGWHHNVPPESVSPTSSMHHMLALDLCAMNSSLNIANLSFHIHLISTPVMRENFESLLHLRTLQSLNLTCCNLGPGAITTALTYGLLTYQTIEMGSLRSLNLSKNGLGKVEDKRLQPFFKALFGLPKLPVMSIDLSHNDFNSHHFGMMYSAWSDTTELQVGFLSFARNYYANKRLISELALRYDISDILFGR